MFVFSWEGRNYEVGFSVPVRFNLWLVVEDNSCVGSDRSSGL